MKFLSRKAKREEMPESPPAPTPTLPKGLAGFLEQTLGSSELPPTPSETRFSISCFI